MMNSEKPTGRAWELYDLLHDMLYILAAVLLLFVFLMRTVSVIGPSMTSTLLDGDRLALLSNAVFTNPEPGDVVVASVPTYEDGEAIVKRVIAVEGQTVDIRYQDGIGTVYVDDVPLDEPYINEPMQIPSYQTISFPITVPEGCVYVMGDNRNHSADSRYPLIGVFDKRYILGRVLMIVYPGRENKDDPREFRRLGVVH